MACFNTTLQAVNLRTLHLGDNAMTVSQGTGSAGHKVRVVLKRSASGTGPPESTELLHTSHQGPPGTHGCCREKVAKSQS